MLIFKVGKICLLVKMFKVLQLPIFLLLLTDSLSLENGLARTPPMGDLTCYCHYHQQYHQRNTPGLSVW